MPFWCKKVFFKISSQLWVMSVLFQTFQKQQYFGCRSRAIPIYKRGVSDELISKVEVLDLLEGLALRVGMFGLWTWRSGSGALSGRPGWTLVEADSVSSAAKYPLYREHSFAGLGNRCPVQTSVADKLSLISKSLWISAKGTGLELDSTSVSLP